MKLPILPIAFAGMAFMLMYCSPPAEKEAPVVDVVAETPSYSIVEQHELVWKQAIAQLLEMADAMPEDRYDYKPHDSLKTFSGQLAHIAGSSKVIANMFLKDIKPAGPPPDMDLSGISREDLKNMVSTSLNEAWDIIKTTSNDQLLNETTTSFSGNKMSRLEGMMIIHDHLTNHKAKANLYIRMSGISPPKYRYY